MSTVNFNDTTPAPVTGVVNIKFQSDASGNISAYDPVGTWQVFTPTLTCSGSMTASAPAGMAQYMRVGPFVYFLMNFQTTLGGTASNTVFASLPVSPSGFGQYAVCSAVISSPTVTYSPAAVFVDSSLNRLNCYYNQGANFVLGSNTLIASGFYRCA